MSLEATSFWKIKNKCVKQFEPLLNAVTSDCMRRFALIENRAMSQGKLPTNDMAGGVGRMDVLVRAFNGKFTYKSRFEHDTEVVLHLSGGPGPSRRIKFVGSLLKGVHAEERAVAGQIAKVLRQPFLHRGIGLSALQVFLMAEVIYCTHLRSRHESQVVCLGCKQSTTLV